MPTETIEAVIVELSPATSAALQHMFAEAQKRGDRSAENTKTVEAFAENLIDYAYERKHSEWKSRDKYSVGKSLQSALAKVQSGKQLNREETELVKAFREAIGNAA